MFEKKPWITLMAFTALGFALTQGILFSRWGMNVGLLATAGVRCGAHGEAAPGAAGLGGGCFRRSAMGRPWPCGNNPCCLRCCSWAW